jgi:hypothetical protein
MNKAYRRVNWQNSEEGGTALNANNLNQMDVALYEIDNRVVEMDSAKANQSDLLTTISNVTFDEKTGLFTFTKKNGATFSIDTKIEKIAVNFVFDEATQRIVITLDDGTKQYVDVSSFITQLEFLNSSTVNIVVQNGKVRAEIVKGSITDEYIEPNYLANIKVEASKAETASASAKASEERAINEAQTAKEASENAQNLIVQVNKRLNIVVFEMDDEGNLVYTDNSTYRFVLGDDGNLYYEIITT